MSQDIYHRLREQLDQYSVGFPATESGVELEILKALFTESEAALFASLTARLESPASAAERLGLPVEETAARLESMASKGLLYRKRQDGVPHYSAIPFIHGLLEFQLPRLEKNLVRLVGRYIREKFSRNIAIHGGMFIRTIPVQQAVEVKHHIAAYEDAREILRNQELIVVTDCACRKQTGMFDRDCGKPIEVCFMFGPMGQYYLDNDMGRQVGFEEALEILTMAQEAGLVTQPAGAKKTFLPVQLLRRLLRFPAFHELSPQTGGTGLFQLFHQSRR